MEEGTGTGGLSSRLCHDGLECLVKTSSQNSYREMGLLLLNAMATLTPSSRKTRSSGRRRKSGTTLKSPSGIRSSRNENEQSTLRFQSSRNSTTGSRLSYETDPLHSQGADQRKRTGLLRRESMGGGCYGWVISASVLVNLKAPRCRKTMAGASRFTESPAPSLRTPQHVVHQRSVDVGATRTDRVEERLVIGYEVPMVNQFFEKDLFIAGLA